MNEEEKRQKKEAREERARQRRRAQAEKHAVPCPHCGKAVLDHMTKCPYCGGTLKPYGYTPMDEGKKRKIKGILWGVLGAAARQK